MYTSNSHIDHLYQEVRETIILLRREGGHLEVAYDTFITVTGRPQQPLGVACGLVAVLATVAMDRRWKTLPIEDRYPGVSIKGEDLATLEVRRAWDMWCKLSREIDLSLEYLEANMPQANHCACVPVLVERAIAELSATPDIRAIDLRKLQRVAEANKSVILEAADGLHRAVKKVRDVANQSMAVLVGLREREDLQRQLLSISARALSNSLFDPAELYHHYESEIASLVAALSLY